MLTMVWLLGIVLFIVFWFIFPTFRILVLAVAGIIVLFVVGFIVNSNHKESVQKSLIPISQVQLNDIRLTHDSYSYELKGEVKNSSAYKLLDIYIKVTAFDCPELSITPTCTTIGQDDNVGISLNIPPNQLRAINYAHVNFSDMPKIKGNFLWSYEITGTRGMEF